MTTRCIVLLAPAYPDICSRNHSTPVELQRTKDDWLKLVFVSNDGFVAKEVACVNRLHGCRCDYVRLLRALMVLSEREILSLSGEYRVVQLDKQEVVATLRMNVKVHDEAPRGNSLKDFHLVLCHLQSTALSICRKSRKLNIEAFQRQFLDALSSSCHVVGCRLHSWETDAMFGAKSKLYLSDVFQSLMTHMEVENRENVTSINETAKSPPPLLNIPRNALHKVICLLTANELTSLTEVCSFFSKLAYKAVPGLKLVLYVHQQKGLRWMLHRETPSLINRSMSHPFLVSRTSEKRAKIAIDLLDYKVVELVDTRTRDMFGGMFCDEPGLGKTITMLALILRTKGLFSENSRTNLEIQADADTSSNLRSAPLKDRSIPLQDLVISGASLIIVPDPLVDHWKYQIEVHVAQKALRTFIDENNEDLPSNSKLATYDVVVTSFSRLTKEWRLHRPASVLEKRMPERYGFENTQRYTDGTVRGEASSLLTVHWVRVIVDEGHKLGVQKPTNLMQMARLISAKRRWVMTGTPTPNTLQSADLRFMHGLLVFLRTKPYGEPDGRAWTKAIARPFEQNDPVGFYRLQSLLSRIMIRHTKESIREILPKPIRHTVFIDPTPSEYAQYNVVAAAVRANLVITSMDPHVPGKLHPDSLLNPINRKDAVTVVTNLRFACCGGVSTEIVLSTKAQLETINMLVELEVDSENIAIVTGYLHRVTLPGMTTMCGCCKRELQLLMIVPCGHLCCADCVEDRFLKIGPSCFHCNEVYDPEVFQELQPGFDFCEVDVTKKTKPNSIQNKNRSHQQSGECDCGQMERQGNVVPELVVDASKIYYAANRVRELKKEYARRDIDHESQQSCPARNVKVIIFSQFTEIIWRTKLAFKQQNIATADFITLVNPKARMKALKRFRTDPSLNVLLLSEMGSHGLDLSFVTHVYLMEEVWDKSLEQQVISRAHRMGAQREVYVEKLWMRGSVESEMARIHELDESEETPPRITHDLGPPVRTRKRQRKENKRLLNVAGTKRQKRNRRGDAKKVPTGNKSSFLQRKLDYVLNLLRMVDSSVVAQTRQVRFRVVDEKSNVTIREAVHMMPEYVPRVITSSSARQKLNPRAKLAPREKEKLSKELSVRAVTNDQAVKSKRDSLASKDKHSPWAAAATSTRTPALIGAIITSNLATTPTTNPLSNIHVTKRTSPLNISLSTSTDLTQRPTVNKSTSRNSGAEDIIEIDDDSSPTQPYVQLSGTINVSPKKAKPEVIVIESDSSINCDADNEDNSSNDDSESDSEKVLLSRLVKVAKSYFARRTGTSPSAVNTSGPAQKAVSTLYLDDDETETE